MRQRVFLGFLLCACAVFFLNADTRPTKISYQVKVYTWSFEEGYWYEDLLIKQITEQYGVDGRLSSEALADGKGIVLEKTVYAYEGDTIRKTTTNSQDRISRHAVVVKKGNVETETVTSPEGMVIFSFKTTRTESGNIATVEYINSRDQLVYRRDYEYDRDGNLIRISNTNPDGSTAVVISYRYESFDDEGRWISRSEYFSYGDVRNRPHEIVYRTIEQEGLR